MGLGNEIDAKMDQAKGKVEQEAGKATDDRDLQLKGAKDQFKGAAKGAVEDVKEAVHR